MHFLNHVRQMKARHPTTIGAKVQEAAARLAARQVMRVPWKRFHKYHEEYIRWEAFVLWTKAVMDTEGGAYASVVPVLKKRCAGFVDQVTPLPEPELLSLRLHEWIQDRIFIYAKQEDWLDPLHFYGVRDPRCAGAWAYWEHCEHKWKEKRPREFPAFETWWRLAQGFRLFPEVSATRAADVVDSYVDWLAFAHWLRPLMGQNVKLPIHVARELRRRCPEFAAAQLTNGPRQESWQSLIKYVEGRFFSEVKQERWLDYVREKACCHPRNVRTLAYSDRWLQLWSCSPALPYPPFSQWRRASDDFVEKPS